MSNKQYNCKKCGCIRTVGKNCKECKRIYTQKWRARKRMDPEFREKELLYYREYMKEKRRDPEFRAKELQYKIDYCEKKKITYEEMWEKIREQHSK